MLFGSKCPACGSESVRLAPPASANLQQFRCNECGAEFREILTPARTPAADALQPRTREEPEPM
jgi:transposase-like protein